MISTDTIIAPATPPGEGGIAVIRISGPRALATVQKYFVPSGGVTSFDTHRLYHGRIYDSRKELIDEVMAVYFAAPRSYTTEETVEIHCHGSQLIVRKLLDLFQGPGIRLARPGEFTYRAFLHGRLDLAQAEAVSRLIHATTDAGRRLALSQVSGELSRGIHRISEDLRRHLVFIEAWIDFPEEDLPDEQLSAILRSVRASLQTIDKLTATYGQGRILTEGAAILLVGQPNSGKSSLLNALLGSERAIVTEVPGTTRDYLEEGVTIAGLPVRLIDTAGLRRTDDIVEQAGIDRSRDKIAEADLILFLVDGTRPADRDDHYVYAACHGRPVFLVYTKADLQCAAPDAEFSDLPQYRISTKTAAGLDELRRGIQNHLVQDSVGQGEGNILCEKRHYDVLLTAQANLQTFVELAEAGETLDLLAFELRQALDHLGEFSGETTTEDLLDGIFSQFCIGK